MKFFANILAVLGLNAAEANASACWGWFLDEPECPKSLIK